MFTKDNFYTAYFIDNERKNIEVLIKQEDFKPGNLSVSSIIIPFNVENDQYKKLNTEADSEWRQNCTCEP